MSCCTVPRIAMTATLASSIPENAVWFAGKMERVQAESFLMDVSFDVM